MTDLECPSANTHAFSVVLPVRVTDLNYGKHLGHMATVGIFHNARMLFLQKNGFDELNVDGFGVILLNSRYSFKAQAFFNTNLLVTVDIGEYSKLKFEFVYRATNQETGQEISSGVEEHAFFDYGKEKIARIPLVFLDFLRRYANINAKCV